MSQFLHDDNNNTNAKAIAIPQVFSENSRAKTVNFDFSLTVQTKIRLHPVQPDLGSTQSNDKIFFPQKGI